jgi:hypothetical protein
MKVYKFITHGGLEVNTLSVTREDFDFVWKLPYLHEFADKCCNKLTFLYKNYDAYLEAEKSKHQTDRINEIWAQCSKIQPVPSQDDYMSYLDADGYQGFMPSDVEYCWDPRGNSLATKVCTWQAAPGCVNQFSYQGKSFTGCITGDRLEVWCSMDAAFAGKWRLCTSHCETKVDVPGCHWEKDPACLASFVYRDKTYTDTCATVNHYQAWCSTTYHYTTASEEWKHCNWKCPSTTTAWGQTTTTTYVTTTAASTLPGCPAGNDKTKCLKITGTKGYDPDCCAEQAHAECSHGYLYKAGGICQAPSKVYTCCLNPNTPPPTTTTTTTAAALPQGCIWEPVPGCFHKFSFKGQMRTGCVTDHPEVSPAAWCSLANPYNPAMKPSAKLCVKVCGSHTQVGTTLPGQHYTATTSGGMSPGMIALAAGGAAVGAAGLAAGIAGVVTHVQKQTKSEMAAAQTQQLTVQSAATIRAREAETEAADANWAARHSPGL